MQTNFSFLLFLGFFFKHKVRCVPIVTSLPRHTLSLQVYVKSIDALRGAVHRWMGMEGETLVFLGFLPHHHLHHAESKNQHLKTLRRGDKHH